jgi:hypothetical protein
MAPPDIPREAREKTDQAMKTMLKEFDELLKVDPTTTPKPRAVKLYKETLDAMKDTGAKDKFVNKWDKIKGVLGIDKKTDAEIAEMTDVDLTKEKQDKIRAILEELNDPAVPEKIKKVREALQKLKDRVEKDRGKLTASDVEDAAKHIIKTHLEAATDADEAVKTNPLIVALDKHIKDSNSDALKLAEFFLTKEEELQALANDNDYPVPTAAETDLKAVKTIDFKLRELIFGSKNGKSIFGPIETMSRGILKSQEIQSTIYIEVRKYIANFLAFFKFGPLQSIGDTYQRQIATDQAKGDKITSEEVTKMWPMWESCYATWKMQNKAAKGDIPPIPNFKEIKEARDAVIKENVGKPFAERKDPDKAMPARFSGTKTESGGNKPEVEVGGIKFDAATGKKTIEKGKNEKLTPNKDKPTETITFAPDDTEAQYFFDATIGRRYEFSVSDQKPKTVTLEKPSDVSKPEETKIKLEYNELKCEITVKKLRELLETKKADGTATQVNWIKDSNSFEVRKKP